MDRIVVQFYNCQPTFLYIKLHIAGLLSHRKMLSASFLHKIVMAKTSIYHYTFMWNTNENTMRMVDWSVDWVTLWGQITALQMRPWSASEAAHRTPPGSSALRESEASAANVFCSESKATATKHSVGTEINPSFWKRAILFNLSPWFHWHNSISTTWKLCMMSCIVF